MNPRGNLISISFAFLALSSGASAATSGPMQISVSKEKIAVTSVSPGGAVVLFSCARVSLSHGIGVRPGAVVLRDDARTGAVDLAPAGGVPMRSVWIAVDEQSGQIATAAPREFPLIARTIGASDLRKDVEGEIASLAVDIPRLIVVLVRPGVGAWQLIAFDGGPRDHDGVPNGRVQLAFEDAQPLEGKDKAPKHLKADDVVVAIDPGHLDVFTTRIVK